MEKIEKILGRKEWANLLQQPIDVKGKTILITGASGSIGQQLIKRLSKSKCKIIATDIVDCKLKLDVTSKESIKKFIKYKPDYIVHLAGAKHAPKGEDETIETFTINTIGTQLLLKSFPKSKFVLTSTCKACNPETAYGASKLIAERLVLNSGNSVARFYNVVQTSGNVFEIWKKQKQKQVAPLCSRYFLSLIHI